MNAILSRSVAPLAFALALLSAPVAHAWGPAGHRAVGAVADELLDPQARAEVARLLANDLNKNESPSGRTTLAAVAVWADEIRSTSANRPLWHFDDAPTCGPIPSNKPWCQNGECASTKIEELSHTLGDPSKPERARNEALKWIVHLVGDLHQPLHTATNTYSPGVLDEQHNKTDRGGNDVHVVISGAKTKGARKLHGVWDSDFVALAFNLGSAQSLPPTAVAKLVKRARAVPDNRTGGLASEWVPESNALARSAAYAFDGFACFEPTEGIVVLDAHYTKKATNLIQTQLALAGARLARLLNSTIGQSVAP